MQCAGATDVSQEVGCFHTCSCDDPFFLGGRVCRSIAGSFCWLIPCHLFAECPCGFQLTFVFIRFPLSVRDLTAMSAFCSASVPAGQAISACQPRIGTCEPIAQAMPTLRGISYALVLGDSAGQTSATVGTGTERSPADHPLPRRLVPRKVQVNGGGPATLQTSRRCKLGRAGTTWFVKQLPGPAGGNGTRLARLSSPCDCLTPTGVY